MMCQVLFLLTFIFILIISLSFEFECQLKEESIVGTVLTDILNGRPCNILQRRSLSFNTIQILSQKISVKILPIQENRISTYFEIINNDDLNNKNDHLRIGDIRVKKPIDRESLCSDIGKCCDAEPFCFFQLQVLIRFPPIDGKGSLYSNSQKVSTSMNIETIQIKIIDINDNSPHFSQPVKTIEISESTQIGAKIPLPLAIDEDSKRFNIVNYRLENHEHSLFALIPEWSNFDSTINQIFLKLLQPIDRENISMYNFNLIATDKGKPSLSGKLKIEIKILDANDNQPIFENSTYIINVKESEISGHLILLLKATDKDSGENGLVMYYFSSDVSSEVRKKFHIDSSTGWLSISETLDYEKVKYYTFNVIARDSGTDPAFSKATVKVSVIDCNDNPPKIYLEYVTDSGKRSLTEGPTTINKEYSIVIVNDPDSGNGGLVQCELKETQKFILIPPNNRESSTWKINLVGSLDYEEKYIERFVIVCNDRGEPQLTTSHDEEIMIRDINDNAPIFEHSSYHQTVEENNQAGRVILKVLATDKDSDLNGKISYSIDSTSTSYFSIDSITGAIRTKISFDREKRSSYQISIFARDFGDPTQSGSANVLINISDKNDNTPYFQGLNGGGSYIFEIKENGPSNTIIGTIHAEDPDEGINGQLLYTFMSPVDKFTIHPEQGVIRTNQQLDREEKAVHEFSVRVTDKGITRQENSVSVTVSVIDENDNEPRFVIPTNDSTTVKISYLDTAGTLVARIEAVDKDEGPNSHLDYQIISGNSRNANQEKVFYMDQKNGDIFIQKVLSRQDMGVYVLKIMVSDQGNPPRKSFANYVIKIDNSPQRYQTLNNMKYNQNQYATYSDRPRDDSLSTSVILIVSIALICIIVLVLLTLAVFLCGKRGQEELNEILFKTSDRGEPSPNLHFCFCLSKSRNPRKQRSDSHRFSEMLYNNYSVLPKTFKAASDIGDCGFRKENNFGTLINKDRGNSTGSLLIEKNSQTKPTECQSYQMANFRKEFNPEFNSDSRYISFQGTTDSRTIDEYTTLVNNKVNQVNYQKLQRKLENENNRSPSTAKYGNSSIDPIVYIRCSSTPGNNDTLSDSEKAVKLNPSQNETLSPLFRHFQSGDLLYPLSNSSKSKTLSSRSQVKNRHAKLFKSHFRYPSVPESLNYLSVGSNSVTDNQENQSRLITWDFGQKIKVNPLHKGSFV